MTDQGARKYCAIVPGTSNHHTCNFCGFTMRGGGITRVKRHLSGIDSGRNVRKCDKCPPEVRREMRLVLQEVHEKKISKRTIEDTIRSEMRKQLAPPSDEDLKTSSELYRAMKKPRVYMDQSFGVGSSAAPFDLSDITPRERLHEISDSSLKKRLGRAISKFFINENIPAHLVMSPHFQNMLATAAEMGPSVPIPLVHEIHDVYTNMEVE